MTKLKTLLVLAFSIFLSGCQFEVLNPKGIIAAAEKTLLVDATLLMLIVVIPVIILSLLFTWRYRVKNKAQYAPKWAHNNMIEAICWGVPCFIVIILASMTWVTTHSLDPYHSLNPLNRKKQPIIIEAIALNWKWLFVYPQQHVATINYVQIPVNTPIRFFITADAPMNSLEIPQLAGQIYAMPGMRTKLNLMATETGTFRGLSTNFSGDGFAGMHFVVKSSSLKQFNQWVQTVQQSKDRLTMTRYNQLAKPSKNNPAQYFSSPAEHLLKKVIMKYMSPKKTTPLGKRYV